MLHSPRSRVATVAVALGALLVAAVPATTSAQTAPSNVRIVHAYDAGGAGVGSTQVTVCLDGAIVDDDFLVGDVIGPVEIDPGTHQVAILGGMQASCDGEALLLDESLDVPSGQDLTVMAASDAGAALVLDVLPDDNSCVAPGEGRVVARHAASWIALGYPAASATAPVDVLADDAVLFAGLVNGAQDMADVPAATYQVQVNRAGEATPVLGPLPVEVDAATRTEVYVTGADANLPTAFILDEELSVCEQPTTTTTSTSTTSTTQPTTTTTAPPAPMAVTAQPRFTG